MLLVAAPPAAEGSILRYRSRGQRLLVAQMRLSLCLAYAKRPGDAREDKIGVFYRFERGKGNAIRKPVDQLGSDG